MKDRLVIISHYRVAGQRPQTFLLTKNTHTLVVNFRFFCFLCIFFSCTHLGTFRRKMDTLFFLIIFHMCLILVCALLTVHPVCVQVCLSADGWWVVRKGLSAVLYKLCFKSLLKATGSAFKQSHLTHSTRGLWQKAAADPNSDFKASWCVCITLFWTA